MPTFKPPVYSKQTNAKGQQEASYVFSVEHGSEHGIHMVADSIEISTEMVRSCIDENKEWWEAFLQAFLKQSIKFFSKQYTVQDISTIIQHGMIKSPTECEAPCNVQLIPKHIQIVGPTFVVYWSYICQPVMIHIPGLSDPLPDLNKTIEDVAELNMDDLPMDNPTESVDLSDPTKLYQKQKVKEAILKAKVAYYRAQNQIRNFSDKYGDNYSDSEFELEDTENESDSASEEEDQ